MEPVYDCLLGPCICLNARTGSAFSHGVCLVCSVPVRSSGIKDWDYSSSSENVLVLVCGVSLSPWDVVQ